MCCLPSWIEDIFRWHRLVWLPNCQTVLLWHGFYTFYSWCPKSRLDRTYKRKNIAILQMINRICVANEDGATVTVNGHNNRAMITDFIVPALHGIDVNDIWFRTGCCNMPHISCHNRLIATNVWWAFNQPKRWLAANNVHTYIHNWSVRITA